MIHEQYDFTKIVPHVQEYCVEHEIAVPRWRDAQEEELIAFHANVLRAIRALRLEVAEEDRQGIAQEVANRIRGLGVLQPFLEEVGIEEIIVRNGFVQTEREGQIFDEGLLARDEYFYRLARRIADLAGEELSAEKPQIKVGLPDGSRFTATIPPISRKGTAINVRRFALKSFTFDDLLERGSVDEETVEFLKEAARSMNVSVMFSGRPAAGKTTWLNAFSRYLPDDVQLSCVETFQELQMQVPHPHHLVVEEDPGVMADAINTTILRMRPDVLVIGEVVSREAVEYVMALNLGIVTHTTTHSKSARLALTRLESLSRGSDIPWMERREIIASGLGLVVHLAKEYDEKKGRYRRFMRELLAVNSVRDGRYETETLKEWDGEGFTPLKAGREIWQAR
ncbi:MAG: ATPase, T2SS/T4P/T4SS family [Anaerolineae bacterium]|jgi:pilus assembly protein CpaF